MNDPKIDFSCLDPTRNAVAWEARIAKIAIEATRRRRQLTVMGQLLTWYRPMLAVAAGVALVGAFGFSAMGQPNTDNRKLGARSGELRAEDPAMMLTAWASGSEVPNTEAVMMAFGGSIDEP